MAALAAERGPASGLDQLERLLAEAGRILENDRSDWRDFARIDVRLHIAIAEMAGNPLFAAVLRMVHERVLNSLLEREYHKNLIYLAIKGGCSSVREVSEKIGLDLKRVSYLLADLEKTKRVEFRAMQERKPVFAAL